MNAPVQIFKVESLDKQAILEMDKARVLREWNTAQKNLGLWKDFESSLRKTVVTAYIGDYVPKGTNHVPIGNDYFINAQGKLNYKVDESQIDAARKIMAEKYPGVKFDDLIRWKPELSESAYNKLTEEEKVIMGICLTISEGTPQLEIVKPKRKPTNILTELVKRPDVAAE